MTVNPHGAESRSSLFILSLSLSASTPFSINHAITLQAVAQAFGISFRLLSHVRASPLRAMDSLRLAIWVPRFSVNFLNPVILFGYHTLHCSSPISAGTLNKFSKE